jgi:hypothetical protein
MFNSTKKPKKSNKPVFPSDVAPSNKVKVFKETFPQTLMNYDIIREKAQSQFQPKAPVTETKKPSGPRKLLNF